MRSGRVTPEPRLRANVICLAAGELAYVISTSGERGVSRYLSEREEQTGFTKEEIVEDIQLHLTSDPIAVAASVDPDQLLMVFARFDGVIPADASWRLHEAVGAPAVYVVPAGHYASVLAYPWIIDRCAEFFEEKLSWAPQSGLLQE